MGANPILACLSPSSDNILFGLPFDEERYQKTLEVSHTEWTIKARADHILRSVHSLAISRSSRMEMSLKLASVVYVGICHSDSAPNILINIGR